MISKGQEELQIKSCLRVFFIVVALWPSLAWGHFEVEESEAKVSNTSGLIPLYIGVLLPLSSNGNWAEEFANQSMFAMDLAVADLNNRSDILPDHQIHLVVKDTKGSTALALNLLYEMILSKPSMVAFVGSIEADTTKILAAVTGQWGIIQMGFANSAIGLSNHLLYPYFIRTMGSSSDLNKVKLQICERFGWKKISTITEATEPHAGIMEDLHGLLEYQNFTLVSRQSFYYDPAGVISRLKQKDARIMVASFSEDTARKVLCQAFIRQLYGPKHIFIFRGFLESNWWRTSDKSENLGCSDDDMMAVLQSVITVYFSMYARKKSAAVTAQTAVSFREEMSRHLGSRVSLNSRDVAANAHDGIWAIGFGLNSSRAYIGNKTLHEYTYEDRETTDIFYDHILESQFYGVSGPVGFQEDGDRTGVFIIEQIRDGARVVIGTLQQGGVIQWLLPTGEIWERTNGRPPFDEDRTHEVLVVQSISKVTVVIMGVLAALGVSLAVFFLIFNIKNRKKRYIKMSSPNLNNLIISGICLAYVCVVLLGIDIGILTPRNQYIICGARVWLISFAFTVAFGAMFTKMWRVYSIVINKRTMRKVIKDRHLIAIILVLLLIDIIILVTKEIVDPYRVVNELIEQPRTQEDRANFVQYIHVYRRCSTKYNTVWTVILTVYKSFLMIFGAFLSFQTRTVSVPGLNDSYYVGLSIYNACLCCAVAVPLSLFNINSLNVTYTVTSGFIVFCATTILCTLFLPKFSALYRQQHEVGNIQRFGINTVSSVAGTSSGTKVKMVGREPTQLDEHNIINKKA
ncbi:gamma-aminobutyric acid type B receptor subunit 2-like isoform X2 [Lytechinus variegatus]|uniref:gamma-aminobutyric acid type B receptor subunit 2-like isoform X2 n=1 Tax=Lytechinus variegatus TaxID=7654 RepID=UPI001BB16086|nr:gamma-aminobutyric acid type B receptor subunit 2-like isoform X2 [Lytechinus variegatus]